MVIFIVLSTLFILENETYNMFTLLCLNLKTKIISCFLICVSLRCYYCALEPGNNFQREMFYALSTCGVDGSLGVVG
jgi:hypothetical protein